jgi:hypothetical protein
MLLLCVALFLLAPLVAEFLLGNLPITARGLADSARFPAWLHRPDRCAAAQTSGDAARRELPIAAYVYSNAPGCLDGAQPRVVRGASGALRRGPRERSRELSRR